MARSKKTNSIEDEEATPLDKDKTACREKLNLSGIATRSKKPLGSSQSSGGSAGGRRRGKRATTRLLRVLAKCQGWLRGGGEKNSSPSEKVKSASVKRGEVQRGYESSTGAKKKKVDSSAGGADG